MIPGTKRKPVEADKNPREITEFSDLLEEYGAEYSSDRFRWIADQMDENKILYIEIDPTEYRMGVEACYMETEEQALIRYNKWCTEYELWVCHEKSRIILDAEKFGLSVTEKEAPSVKTS